MDRPWASGSYTIDLDGSGSAVPFVTECEMDTDGGGWTLVGIGPPNTLIHKHLS